MSEMNIPSSLHSPFFSYSDDPSTFDVKSVWSLPSPGPFRSSYNTDNHVNKFNLFDSCDCETPTDISNPQLQTFCNSSPPADGHSWDRLPGCITADKWNHKMIERQRRREMKLLFSQLRSLLPEEKLRGKRTVSEQVLEAVNYVFHLHQKIEDLSAQREAMKVNCDQNAKVSFQKFYNKTPQFVGSDGECPAVKINSVGLGVQILTYALENETAFSDILFALEQSELEVMNSTSSAINNKIYHTIHANVLDLNTFNIHTLYKKLWHLISTQPMKNQDMRVTEDRE